jgi:hypothetical protein
MIFARLFIALVLLKKINMKKIIILHFAIVLTVSAIAQDTTKYKISLGIGFSNSIFFEAKKKEIALYYVQQYRDRDGKLSFDYSDNVQIGFFRKLIGNLYLGIQYNLMAGRYSAFSGSKYNYKEYYDIGFSYDIQPRYISLYSAHVFNLSAQYRFNIKLNQQNKIYIQPSLGYGLGLVRRLNQTMIEYDTREEQVLTGGNTYYTRTVTDRFQTNADINNKITNGFNTAIELGYSFKQFDFGINYNINKLKFAKGSRFGTIKNNALSHVLDWSMLSVTYRF